MQVTHFNDFSPNPTLEEAEAGVSLWRSEKPDAVLGIGGGSALNLAKMINGVAGSKASTRDILTGQSPPEKNTVPVIAVPTTSGSGAEVTHFAAVYVDNKKHSVTHESLRPSHCILDPSLTRSLSPYLTATTGMDALSQAIESYWSVGSTEKSRNYSSQAITLCEPFGVAACNDSTDEARTALMEGAHLAGKAIDIAKTTAPHALSYPLTTGFGVTHGHAVALSLGPVFAFNAAANQSAELSKRMGDLCTLMKCPDGLAASKQLNAMMKDCGLTTQLRDQGVARSDLPRLVQSVNPQRLKNNPRPLSSENLGAILETVY